MGKKARAGLPDSSRVSAKVREYYMKYGKERDLEKFMRLSSQTSSSSSTESTSDEDWANFGNLQRLFHEMEGKSNSAVPSSSKESEEHLIPIVIENDDHDDQKLQTENKDQKSPKTPQGTKALTTDSKQTQTPESAAKSHRRLEWDSLGDVGYRKSKSTSNISIVERMLLREFIEVSTNSVKNTNSSENDIRSLEQEIAELGTLRKIFSKPKPQLPPKEESTFGTPPLASSTHIEKIQKSKRQKQKIKPQFQTVATNTTIPKQMTENYAQTSVRSTQMTSQEVQVTLSPPSISPLLGSSAEPSSFEYHSRYSTYSSEGGKSMQTSHKRVKHIESEESQLKTKRTNEECQTNFSEIKYIDSCEEDRQKSESIIYSKTKESQKGHSANSSTVKSVEPSYVEVRRIETEETNSKANASEAKSVQSQQHDYQNIELEMEKTKKSREKNTTKLSEMKTVTSYDQDKTSEPSEDICSTQPSQRQNDLSYEPEEGRHKAKPTIEQPPTSTGEIKSAKLSKKQAKRSEAGDVRHTKAKETKQNTTQRNVLEVKNDNKEICDRLKNMFISWNNMMEENKENFSSSSSGSTTSNPPQIDLGIQLICGIMKAEHVENQQKKRLVRNIVKRITKIASSCELDAIVNKTASLMEQSSESSTEKSHGNDPIEQIGYNSKEKCPKSHQTKSVSVSLPGTQDCGEENAAFLSSSIPSSSNQANKLNKEKAKAQDPQSTNISESTIERITSSSNKLSTETYGSSKTLPSSISHDASTQMVPKSTEKKVAKSTKITTVASSSSTSSDQAPGFDISLCVSKTESGGDLISAVFRQPETNSSTTSASSSASAGPSAKNVTKKQPVTLPVTVPQGSLVYTVENGAMQEWLNPMTQSEVEFEDKKRNHAPAVKKPTQREPSGTTASSENSAGLNWIDMEIQRLQKLKHILLNEGTSKSKILPPPLQEASVSSESADDKFYDTVFSAHSPTETRSTAGEVRKVVSVIKISKKTTDAKVGKGAHEQQFNCSQIQRSKIDTPTGTTGSESVESYVRQRRQEFLDHYKNQKINHYDQILDKYNQGQSTSKSSVVASQCHGDGAENYSGPVFIKKSYFTYPPKQKKTYQGPSYIAETHSKQETLSKNPTKSQHTLSSELSVPMGSYNSHSTPTTTTHQYDLATTGGSAVRTMNIGSQTDHSLTRCRPIYETRCLSPYHAVVPRPNYPACTCLHVAKTVCIQARPKGVSYTLHFPSGVSHERAGDNNEDISARNAQYSTLDKSSAPCLQAALKHGHPQFVAQAKKRKSILNRIQKLRQARERELREIADGNTSISSLDRQLEELPPAVTEKLRIFPTKQMKALTNKRVAKLPEVIAKQELKREERYKRSNRLLRELFNRRLRERVRKGRLTFNHSSTII